MGVKIGNKNVIALRIGNTPIVKRYINSSIVYRSGVPEVTDYDILAVYDVTDTSSATRILSNINHVEYAYLNDRPIDVAMDYAFAQSGTYTLKVKLQDKIDSVPSYSFKSCKNLVSVDISARLTVLGTEAFYGCTKLTSVTLPDTLTAIYADAFYNCTSLTSVEIPNSVTRIESSAFYNCNGLTSIEIPDSVTFLGGSAFHTCTSLASVEIGNGVTSIDGSVFHGCSGLTSVTIGSSVTSIGGYAFNGCTSLTSIDIPDSVTSIGYGTFYNCTSLASIEIGSGVTSIGAEAFRQCPLRSISIDNNNTTYSDGGGYFIINKTTNTLQQAALSTRNIPDGITVISSFAYEKNTLLRDIVIPDSVTTIGERAFQNCSKVESVIIGKGITSINDYAFRACRLLKSVTFNATIAPTVGNEVFNSITTSGTLYYPCGSDYSAWIAKLPSNWTSECIKGELEYNVTMTCNQTAAIGEIYFLNDLSRVEKMEIDGVEVTPVGNKTFDSGIHTIKVKFSDNSIPSNTLYNINTIDISEDIESIETGAFQLTDKLTSVTVSSYNKYYTAKNNCVIELLSGKMIAGVGEFTIPEDVTSIGMSAAWNNDFITEISIPDSVTTIEDGAFSDCANLSSVTIGSGVTSVGDSVFTRCSKLSSITCNATTAPTINGYLDEFVIYGGFSIAEEGTFNYPCESDYSTWLAQLPSEWVDGCASEEPSYNVIATYRTTSNNTTLKVLGNTTSLTKMNVDGEDVDNTTSVVFPTAGEHVVKFLYSDVDTLPGQAFGSSSSWVSGAALETVEVNSLNIGSYTFARCKKLKSVTLNDVKVLGNYAFDECTGLTSIDMQDSVTTIGERVFLNCSGLTSIDIPNSVTSIGTSAFNGCKNLASIEIPDSVTSLGNMAFYDCNKVTSITIGSGLTSIGNNALPTANVESITVNKGEVFEGDNCIIKNNGSLTSLVLGCKNTVIPSKVNHIGDYAFYNCNGLTSIDIPDSVTNLGLYAFNGCSGLTSVRLSNSITLLKNNVFADCTSLTDVVIPDSVTEISNYAFSNCTSLTNITIPSNVTRLGQYSFRGCTNLSWIESVATTAPTLGTDVFANIAPAGTLYYPCESDYSTWIEALPNEWTSECTNEEPSYDVTATVVVTSTTSTTELAKAISSMSAMFIDGVEIAPTSAYTFSTTGEHTVGYNFTSTSLPSNVYSGCSTITEIVIGDRITSLASGNASFMLLQGTFGNMPSLEKVTIGNGITSLNANYGGTTTKAAASPFGKCPSLREINLGESITAITGPVFMGCGDLSSITIPASVQDMSDYIASGTTTGEYGVFQGCTSLKEVIFEGSTAPSIDVHTFPNGNAGTFYYPCGSDYSAVASQLSMWTDGCGGDIGGDIGGDDDGM